MMMGTRCTGEMEHRCRAVPLPPFRSPPWRMQKKWWRLSNITAAKETGNGLVACRSWDREPQDHRLW